MEQKYYDSRAQRGLRTSGRVRNNKGIRGRGGQTTNVVYRRPPQKLWNESTRPSFIEDTWTTLLTGKATQQGNVVHNNKTVSVTHYQCPVCNNYAYRRKDAYKALGLTTATQRKKFNDLHKGDRFLSIDHHKPWKRYIWDNAAVTDQGRVTQKGAAAAYNDTFNLKLMCNKCNSSKNGEKGVFD